MQAVSENTFEYIVDSYYVDIEKLGSPKVTYELESPKVSYDVKRLKFARRPADHNLDLACMEFLSAIQNTDIEYGYESQGDRYLASFAREHADVFVNLFTKLSSLTYDSPSRYAALLKAAGAVEYSKDFEDIFIPIAAAGVHEDRRVQEAMLHLFESWRAKDSLRILKSIKINSTWLERYRQKVIQYIESSAG